MIEGAIEIHEAHINEVLPLAIREEDSLEKEDLKETIEHISREGDLYPNQRDKIKEQHSK